MYVWSDSNKSTNNVKEECSLSVDEEDTDEELEEKYANLEVDFDESETEEDDYVPRKFTSRIDADAFIEEVEEDDFPDEFLLYETREFDGPVTVSRGKSFIQDDIHSTHGHGRVPKYFIHL